MTNYRTDIYRNSDWLPNLWTGTILKNTKLPALQHKPQKRGLKSTVSLLSG